MRYSTICPYQIREDRLDDEAILELLQQAQFPARTERGPYWDLVTAPAFRNRTERIVLGVPKETADIARRTGTRLIQFYQIVRPQLVNAEQLYRGVKRNMKVRGDMNADQSVHAYALHPTNDVLWRADRFTGRMETQRAPENRVYAVIVRPYATQDEYGVDGVVLRWNWLHADPVTGMPVDEDDRYEEALWELKQ